MAHYADQISTHHLLKQLRASKGRDEISATEVEQLVAMVLDTADIMGPLLDRIPLTFRQYTQHDIRHSANVIKLMGKLIPARTQKRLNAVELAVLAISAIVHDAGMFVSDAEREEVVASAEYRRYEAGQGERTALLEKTRAAGEHVRAAALQDALLAEYFRRLHPERAAIVVRRHLQDRLTFRETDLTGAVLRVAESHAWGVLESNDPRDPEKSVSRLSTRRPVFNVPVNEQYLACCLRLADIMDFDRSRTPASVFQHLGFTEEKSWEEWNKHLQVEGWQVDEHEVMYSASCSHPAFYVSVMEFLDWIDAELRDCRHLIKEASRNIADRYELHLPPIVDRRQVEMEDRSYLAGAFRFQLDYERIMQLLMDRSLYPDPSLFLRELLQNSLDACRTREAHAKAAGHPYIARIAVWDHSSDPHDPRIVFQDNGIGMSRRIVEQYFMRVGRSYYKSAEFDLERQRLAEQRVELEATSQFGIGILSCFMVADRFEVETYRFGNRPLHITIEGPTKYFTIRTLPEPARADFTAPPATLAEDGPPNHPGTRVTVHLKPGSRVDAQAVLHQFAVNVDYDIHVHDGGTDACSVVPAWSWRHVTPVLKGTEVELNKFVRYTADEERAAATLNSILVPARVPFESYDFSAHLDGQAWFWLLRGSDGEPSPSRELLQTGTEISCRGVAAFAARLMEFEQTQVLEMLGVSLPFLVTAMEQSIEDQSIPFESYKVPSHAVTIKGIDPAFWEHCRQSWTAFSDIEKHALIRALRKLESNPTPWYSDADAATALLEGGTGWAKGNIDLSARIAGLRPTSELALHGILLPAGMMSWNPMRGVSERQNVLHGPVGGVVDIRRGRVAPAASRLFIDSRDAEQLSVPLLRACIRFGQSLCLRPGADAFEWRRWLGEILVPLFYHVRWRQILEVLEMPHLERTQGYVYNDNGARTVHSREELVSQFGKRVPLNKTGAGEGIDDSDMVNRLLLFRRELSTRGDGTPVMDLGTGLEDYFTKP
jgi:hypothetical protein